MGGKEPRLDPTGSTGLAYARINTCDSGAEDKIQKPWDSIKNKMSPASVLLFFNIDLISGCEQVFNFRSHCGHKENLTAVCLLGQVCQAHGGVNNDFSHIGYTGFPLWCPCHTTDREWALCLWSLAPTP